MHYTMACPLVQQVFEHAFRDCRSFQKDGAEGEGSKAVCLEPCLGRQEPLHQLTERGTPSFFSNNFNLTTMIQKRDGDMETEPILWVSLPRSSYQLFTHRRTRVICRILIRTQRRLPSLEFTSSAKVGGAITRIFAIFNVPGKKTKTTAERKPTLRLQVCLKKPEPNTRMNTGLMISNFTGLE